MMAVGHVTDTIITQYAEEMSFIWLLRVRAVCAPHFALRDLTRFDDRIAAHIDGLRVAGEPGWQACETQLPLEESGAMFAAMVLALEGKHLKRIETLFSLGEAVPAMQTGLISAFGWISAHFLQGTAKELLAATSPFRRRVGIACCAMHGVYPGQPLDVAINDADLALRARALRAVGELGRRDLLPICHEHLSDQDSACHFRAAWSAVLVGDRGQAIDVLQTFTLLPGPYQERVLQLVLKVSETKGGHALLKMLAQDPASLRRLIQGAGIAGDPYYVPWLIKQMEDIKLTRLAGESFSLITGVDLAYLDLERKPADIFESGPNEDPNEENVAMDADEDLPWPDPPKVQAWWGANKHRFQPGVRYFMGAPPTREHCIKILKEGYQRQRIAAALYLSLLNPGTPLFNTSAPAWRQQRWLAKMT